MLPTCREQLIIDHLLTEGFAIEQVTNIQKHLRKGEEVNKKRLPLFMLTFSQKEDTRKIYDIQYILGSKVKIEPLRKRSNLIPQCKKCQGFGNTQNNCFKEPRCVKCAGRHETNRCEKPKDLKAKCVNCNEAHPANYRGCMFAKELQKIRNEAMRKQQHNGTRGSEPDTITTAKPMGKPTSGNTYAQSTKGNNQKQHKQIPMIQYKCLKKSRPNWITRKRQIN